MKHAAILLTIPALLLAVTAATGAIVVDLNGGGDHLTLSDGIAAAAPGDTVLVAPGTYAGELNRDLSFEGKDIALVAMGPGRDPVIIDAEEAGRCFLFDSGEGPDARIEGIVMVRGGAGDGGAILCYGYVSPTFVNCDFTACTASRGGGLNCADGASPTVTGCTFRENAAGGAGGGIRCTNGASVDVRDCLFKCNSAAWGGGIMVRAGSSATIDGTTFEANEAVFSGGLRVENATATVTNSTFLNNAAESGGGMGSGDSGLVTMEYCVFRNNVATNRGAGYACGTPADVRHCTFVGGTSPTGSGVFSGPPQGNMVMSNCIVAFGDGPAMTCDPGGAPGVARCCFYGNSGGDTPCVSYTDILYDNPWFCGLPLGDLTVNEVSVCVPENNPWGEQIGAFGAGCTGAVPIERASWGNIKAMYR